MAAMANECLPEIEDSGQPRLTGHATAALTGKRVVMLDGGHQSGPALNTSVDGSNIKVKPATAGARGIGVASWDTAAGGKCPIVYAPGTVLPITAGGTIASGDPVTADATGRAIAGVAAGGVVLGTAVDAATVGNDCMVMWGIGTGAVL